MSGFKDREKAFENKMVLDADQEFKLNARRNKLLGLWVAKRIGKDGDEADAYALSVIKSDMEEEGDEDVFRKVKQDLISAGINLSDADIRERMQVLMTEARSQLFGDS